MKKNRCKRGFTLIELMVTIAIMAILGAIATPNMISWRNNAQVNSAARDLYSNFQYAKSTAIKRNMNCSVVFNEDVGGTVFDLAIFLENASDADLQYDAGEEVLKTIDFSEYGSVVLGNANLADNGAGNPAVSFRPNGFPYASSGALGGGTVVLKGSMDKEIALSNAGNLQINVH